MPDWEMKAISLHNPLVRDLAWCVFSPPLINLSEPLEASDQDIRWLQNLDNHPQALENYLLAMKSHRLGFRFEHFWHFWLTHRYCQDPMEHRFNLQLKDDTRTLGEIDSLSFNLNTGQLVHREFAVKFYLAIESSKIPEPLRSAEPTSYLGTQVKDRLDIKTRQLSDRQLKQMSTEAARKVLPLHWKTDEVQIRAIVKGRIFFHLNDPEPPPPSPLLYPQHLSGLWLKHAQLHLLPTARWLVLSRHQWFAPLSLDADHPSLTTEELLKQVSDPTAVAKRPVQLAQITDEHQEIERYFLVPDYWPSTTQPSR